MTYAVPVVDLEDVQLEAVRAGRQELGAVQVVNHGVPAELSGDLERRMARLLSMPRAEKARLASPHPYRGWRQWPDDFGRPELERFNVAQFDDVSEASVAGVGEEYLGLYAHDNLWPADDPGLRETARAYMQACRELAERMLRSLARPSGPASAPEGFRRARTRSPIPGEAKMPDGRPCWTPAALRSWQSRRKIAGRPIHGGDSG